MYPGAAQAPSSFPQGRIEQGVRPELLFLCRHDGADLIKFNQAYICTNCDVPRYYLLPSGQWVHVDNYAPS